MGSFETRVLTTARKFEDLKAAPESASIANLQPVDSNPRGSKTSNSTSISLTLDTATTEAILTPNIEDDFAFVPLPPTSARSAAADLRSALE